MNITEKNKNRNTTLEKMNQSLPEISREGVMGWLRKNLLLVLTFSGVIGGFGLGIGLRPFNLDDSTIDLLGIYLFFNL